MSVPTTGQPSQRLVSTLAREWAVDVRVPGTSTPSRSITAAGASATKTFTATAHALTNGQQLTVTTAGPSGLTGTLYVVNAAANTFQVSATTGGAPSNVAADGQVVFSTVATSGSEWLRVRAVTSFKRTTDNNTEDDTDFDGEGYKSNVKTEMGWKLEIGLGRKVSPVTGEYDRAQEYLREQADKFTPDDEVEIRYYQRSGRGVGYQGWCSPEWQDEGDKSSDLATASVTLNGQGKREKIANPVEPAA